MTLAELRKSRVWAGLSPQQQLLLDHYLAGGLAQGNYDITAAVQIAYPKIANATVWRSRLKANPAIRAALALYFGDPTKDLREDIKCLIRRARRKNANRDLLLGPWERAVQALEKIAASGITLAKAGK